MSRYERVQQGAAEWGAYYRLHPDKFVEEYLHIKLKLFQKIMITMMFWSTIFVFVACRGIGKTYLSAIYCVTRAILYPGSRICVASWTRAQATLVLEKINLDLRPRSPELCAEIDEKETKINTATAIMQFKNTSVIKVVTASDSARGNRANVLLLDEFRLMSKETIDTVLKKFLTQQRMPDYEELTDEERAREYDKESNLAMYLSSAFYKDHWSYTRCLDTFKAMLSGNHRQFIGAFPYQLSIAENLLSRSTVEDEMSESDFNEIKWSMEMDAMFYGSGDDAFFDFSSLSRARKIKYPMYPANIAAITDSPSSVRVVDKRPGEIRILSADIALMASKKHQNDATAVFINQMLPTKAGRYSNNIVYSVVDEGLRTDVQALKIRKLYDEYNCDYIVLDCAGVGLGIYDALSADMTDTDTGEIYPALSCYNDSAMAERCQVPGAAKVIWSVKAGSAFNSDCALLLREGIRGGKIRLLSTEYDAEGLLKKIKKGYDKMSVQDKMALLLPYVNTTLLIDELTKLQHEQRGGQIRVYERQGMRKDRYSSLAYNYYVATQIEAKMIRQQSRTVTSENIFIIKPPRYKSTGRQVKSARGGGKPNWC